MKKLLTILVALFLSLSIVSFAVAQDMPDLDGLVISVGTDPTYPPHETVDPDTGEIVGFDVDVMNAICERVNCVAEFVSTAWDGIFPALAEGQFDMVVSGVTITEERDEIVDFSDPYIIISQGILIRTEDEGLTLEDYESGIFTLGSQAGTTNFELSVDIVGRENVEVYDAFSLAIEALAAGDIDGVMIDNSSGDAYAQQYAGQLVLGITGLQADPLGLVFQEGSALVDAFNAGLAMIKEDGTMMALEQQWFVSGDE